MMTGDGIQGTRASRKRKEKEAQMRLKEFEYTRKEISNTTEV